MVGAALMNDQKDLSVCDTGLGSLRIVKYIGKRWHNMVSEKHQFRTLKLLGSLTVLLWKEHILLTDQNAGAVCLLNLSEDVQTLSVSCVISGNDTEHLMDRLPCSCDIIAVTDRTSIDMNSGEVKVIKVEENDGRKSFGYRLNDNVKFPFGL